MKRKLLALFVVSSCLIGNVFSQDEEYTVGTTIGGTADDVCRFSFGIKGGLNYLRVSDQKVQPAGGAFVEITINPLWGIGAEYMYLMNDRKAIPLSKGLELGSTVQDVTIFGSLNVSNVIAKYRSHGWQKWNVYANLGAGISIYDWKLKDDPNDRKDDGIKPVAVAGLALEFNAAKWVAIGLDGQYRFHTNTDFVGGNAGRSMIGANLSVRFKIGGERNVRNKALVEYDPTVEVNEDVAGRKQFDELAARVDDRLATQDASIQKLQAQVRETQDTVNALKNRLKTPVKYAPTKEETAVIQTAFSQLEFESGKDVIKLSSYSALNELASLLKQHPEWSVILKGYTDNVGNAQSNLQLSRNRAESVKSYLVGRGVSASAIQTFGYGAENPVATNSTPEGRAQNRRVEIELFSK